MTAVQAAMRREGATLSRSALYVVASSLLFALAGVMVKLSVAELPKEVVVFFRNAFSLCLLLPWLAVSGLGAVRTSQLRLHLLRAAATLSALYCYYYAISHVRLADAVLLQFTGPIFVPLLGYAIYRIAVSGQVLLAVLVGFVGIALILQPGSGMFTAGAAIGLGAGLFGALAVVTIWRMSVSEPPLRIVFYFNLLSTIASAVPLIWSWQTPTGIEWVYLGALALLSTGAHILMTIGCTIAPADRAYTLSYSSVVFAAVLGWLVWGEGLDALMIAGAALVGVAGTMATRLRRTRGSAVSLIRQ
jgi:drug/metabolite transporter (DMT)-like permease